MVRMLIHVMIVVIGFSNVGQNLLFVGIENVGKRMRNHTSHMRLDGVFRGGVFRNRSRDPKNRLNVRQLAPGEFCAGGNLFFGVLDVFIGDTHEHNHAVGNPAA